MIKLCECGCGMPAPIAKGTDRLRGCIKGQPRRFILGHVNNVRDMNGDKNPSWKGGRRKSSQSGYVFVHHPGHPRANKNSIQEHIIVAEHALGRHLPPKALVHHVNGRRCENQGRNLVICEDDAYHLLLHKRARAIKAGHPATWRKCWKCKTYDEPSNLFHYGSTAVHRQRALKCVSMVYDASVRGDRARPNIDLRRTR